jgi:hypothetical protein
VHLRPSVPAVHLFHVRALQVLDGLAVGGTHRELAVAVFGIRAVDRDWQPDSALRAQLRYLIRSARALMEGGYRSLVDSGSALSYSGNTGGNRHKWVTDNV